MRLTRSRRAISHTSKQVTFLKDRVTINKSWATRFNTFRHSTGTLIALEADRYLGILPETTN